MLIRCANEFEKKETLMIDELDHHFDEKSLDRNLQSFHELGWEAILSIAYFIRIGTQALLHQHTMFDINIQRILCGYCALFVVWQQLQDHFGKEIRVAAGILLDGLNQ